MALLLVVGCIAAPAALASHFAPNANMDGTAPISDEGAAASTGRAAGNIFAIEGRITGVDVPNRIIQMVGFSFRLPDTMTIDVGDPTVDTANRITWESFTSGPVLGWTVIAQGEYTTDTTVAPAVIRFVPTHVFVEESETVLGGPVTHNTDDPDALWINGVRVVMETDARVSHYNEIIDEQGKPVTLDVIPDGTIAFAEGSYDAAGGFFRARVVEAEFIYVDPNAVTDFISVDRAEGRTDSRELRVQGTGSDVAQSITLYGETSAGVRNPTPIATGIAINDVDGFWSFRAKPINQPVPDVVVAVSTGGGEAQRAVVKSS